MSQPAKKSKQPTEPAESTASKQTPTNQKAKMKVGVFGLDKSGKTAFIHQLKLDINGEKEQERTLSQFQQHIEDVNKFWRNFESCSVDGYGVLEFYEKPENLSEMDMILYCLDTTKQDQTCQFYEEYHEQLGEFNVWLLDNVKKMYPEQVLMLIGTKAKCGAETRWMMNTVTEENIKKKQDELQVELLKLPPSASFNVCRYEMCSAWTKEGIPKVRDVILEIYEWKYGKDEDEDEGSSPAKTIVIDDPCKNISIWGSKLAELNRPKTKTKKRKRIDHKVQKMLGIKKSK